MGHLGDVEGLRTSSIRLRSTSADFARFAASLPTAIPATVWDGPAATAWSEVLPGIGVHLKRVSHAQASAADVVDDLANQMEELEDQRRVLLAAGAFPTDLPVMEIVIRADAAKRSAAQRLRELADGVQLTRSYEYVSSETAVAASMSGEDKAILAADIAGLFDPTPAADATATVLSLKNGDLLGATLSAIGIIPYLGDTAKGLKYGGRPLKSGGEVLTSVPKHGDNVVRLTSHVDISAGYRRLPNHSFTSNGFAFVTDEAGRTVVVSGQLMHTPAPRSPFERTIGHFGLPGDQGGHLIAARFGGPSTPFNLAPQSAPFNQSTFKSVENYWASLLAEHRTVDVSIRATFDKADSIRPEGFLVEYSVDGVEQPARYFLNE